MICYKCQAYVNDHSRFCSSCGSDMMGKLSVSKRAARRHLASRIPKNPEQITDKRAGIQLPKLMPAPLFCGQASGSDKNIQNTQNVQNHQIRSQLRRNRVAVSILAIILGSAILAVMFVGIINVLLESNSNSYDLNYPDSYVETENSSGSIDYYSDTNLFCIGLTLYFGNDWTYADWGHTKDSYRVDLVHENGASFGLLAETFTFYLGEDYMNDQSAENDWRAHLYNLFIDESSDASADVTDYLRRNNYVLLKDSKTLYDLDTNYGLMTIDYSLSDGGTPVGKLITAVNFGYDSAACFFLKVDPNDTTGGNAFFKKVILPIFTEQTDWNDSM